MKLTINPRLIPLKGHYFFFFAALGCLMPFLPVYIEKLGVNTSSISIIYLIIPLTTVIAKPLLGNLADMLRRHKFVFIANVIVMSAFYFGISFVPNLTQMIEKQFDAVFSCDLILNESNFLCPIESIKCKTNVISCTLNPPSDNTSTLSPNRINITENLITCSNLSNIYTNNTCNSSVNCILNCEDTDLTNVDFVLLFTCMIISAMAAAVSLSLADTIAFHLSTQENVSYGVSRLWGSIGWGLAAIVAGYVYSIVDFGQTSSGSINLVFYIFIALCLADICVISQIHIGDLPKPKHMWKSLTKVACQPFFILFTSSVFIMGIMTGALWTFQMLYVQQLGGSPLLFGLIMGVQCFLGEIPFFLLADMLLKKIGHTHAMTICIICFSFRYICYSFLQNPWFILPLELINGVTFGLFFAAVVSFASVNAPPGMSATMQGIEQGVFEGFGLGIGNLISGQLMAHYGGRSMYLYLGIGAGCFALVYEMCVCVLNRLNPALIEQIEFHEKIGGDENVENDISKPVPNQ